MSEIAHASQQPLRPKVSKVAVWSLVLGILSITCLWILGSIPAIILGVKGMKKADADPTNVGGKGLSLAGIITGAVGIVTGIAIAALYVLPEMQATRENAAISRDINHVRCTLLGIAIYSADYDGVYPENLADLLKEGYIDYEVVLRSYEPTGKEGQMILYRAGFSSVSRSSEPILLSPKTYSGGKRVVGFAGGHVNVLPPSKLVGIVEKFE